MGAKHANDSNASANARLKFKATVRASPNTTSDEEYNFCAPAFILGDADKCHEIRVKAQKQIQARTHTRPSEERALFSVILLDDFVSNERLRCRFAVSARRWRSAVRRNVTLEMHKLLCGDIPLLYKKFNGLCRFICSGNCAQTAQV